MSLITKTKHLGLRHASLPSGKQSHTLAYHFLNKNSFDIWQINFFFNFRKCQLSSTAYILFVHLCSIACIFFETSKRWQLNVGGFSPFYVHTRSYTQRWQKKPKATTITHKNHFMQLGMLGSSSFLHYYVCIYKF